MRRSTLRDSSAPRRPPVARSEHFRRSSTDIGLTSSGSGNRRSTPSKHCASAQALARSPGRLSAGTALERGTTQRLRPARRHSKSVRGPSGRSPRASRRAASARHPSLGPLQLGHQAVPPAAAAIVRCERRAQPPPGPAQLERPLLSTPSGEHRSHSEARSKRRAFLEKGSRHDCQ